MDSMSAPTGALAVLGRRRRIIEDGGAHNRSSDSPPWVSGILAALQALVLSLAVIIVPAVATYVATSADPANVGATWIGAVGIGARLWLLGHGTPLATGTHMVTLIPLGLSILLAFACYASARRTARPAWSALWAGVGSYTGAALIVALLAGARTPGQVVLAVAGAGIISTIGLGAGIAAHDENLRRAVTGAYVARVSPLARVAIRGGVLAVSWIVLAATALVLAWIFMGRTAALDIVHALHLSLLDAVILAVGQAMYAANLVAWGLAWIVGPGFAVGAGSQFAPDAVVAGPLPAIPILGALPDPSSVNAVAAFVPVILALAGVAAALYVRRRCGFLTWSQVGFSVGLIVVTAGALISVFVGLSGGGIGPGRMGEIGPDSLLVAGWAMLWITAGAVPAFVLTHAGTHHGVRMLINWRTWQRWFNRATSDHVAPPPVVPQRPVPAPPGPAFDDGAGEAPFQDGAADVPASLTPASAQASSGPEPLDEPAAQEPGSSDASDEPNPGA